MGVSALAVCAVSVAWGYPTAKEMEAAQPLVNELMAPAMRGKPAEAASAAIELAKDAETEAAKFLLLRGAVDLYARAGDDAKAAETFTALLDAVKDVPAAERERILLSAGRTLSKGKKPERIQALYREARARTTAEREAETALAALEKSPRSAAARLRAGNAYAVLGDWPKALEHLGGADGEIAPLAQEEAGGEAAAEKLADGWWKAADEATGAEVKAAYRAHAAAFYRKALEDGALAGLRKTLAERRVAEAEQQGTAIQTAGRTAASGTAASETARTLSPLSGSVSLRDAPYCVVDLSAGPDAKHYPVKYLLSPPSGWSKEKGWPDAYKTTKLVLRRIEPGTFIPGQNQTDESHRITLTKPFYIGVFEVTQKQMGLVLSSKWNPAQFKGDARPAQLHHADIRGSKKGQQWPATSEVDTGCFLDRIRRRTGLEFDLPTEAEWEYACRAGTTSKYNNGGESEDDLKKLGRYKENQSDGKGGYSEHTVVGSYQPNAWGLYDMHGNVWEVCLDTGIGLNPKNPTNPGKFRIKRGGSYSSQDCPSTVRTGVSMWARWPDSGFRLVFHPAAEIPKAGSR